MIAWFASVNEYVFLFIKVAGEITARQDESDVGRKALIDGMKEFKKDNDDEVRTAVAPLIRSFQNEVDALARYALFIYVS